MKIIIIGAVAGGPSLATRLRRLDEDIDIVMFERGQHISFASCGLPYYLGHVIKERDSLIERTPEVLKEKNNIDVRIQTEVTAIDPEQKIVTATNLVDGSTYTESYDKLILATGARPTVPKINGLTDATNLFTIRNVTDADKISDFIETNHPHHVTIVGGGTAGIELAENFQLRGLTVSIVERSEHVAAPFDPEITEILEKQLIKHKIDLHTNANVDKITEQGKSIHLSSGETLKTDMLIFVTGVVPNSELAPAAKITLAPDKHIIVDEHLQTNVADIYAIGDVIETTSYITGLPIQSVLSSAANRQGHLLADALLGADLTYRGFIGAGVAQVFDMTVSYTGYTEQALEAAGVMNYQSIFITPFDHAYFYPNAKRLNLKVTYHPSTGAILGAQAIGHSGVDKRIGELSVAITGNLTVHDLPDLELPYSPPYSTTRDPLNTAGYVAINQLNQADSMVPLKEIPADDLKSAFFLAIHEDGKTNTGSITPNLSIPLNDLRDRLAEFPTNKKIYITHRPGLNNYTAARILAGHKYEVSIVEE